MLIRAVALLKYKYYLTITIILPANAGTSVKYFIFTQSNRFILYAVFFHKEAQSKFLGRHTGESPEGSSVALQ
jgi:hypothetical protein